MKKINLIFIFFILLFFSSSLIFGSPEIDEAINRAKQLREKIILDCQKDPFSCSCEIIPCEDVLDSGHERAREGYERCLEEKRNCEKRLEEGRKKMEQQREKITANCREDLEKCDCSTIESAEGRRECEVNLERAKREADEQREKFTKIISEQCEKDFDKCSCSMIDNEQGRAECEIAILNAKKQAQEERDKMIRICSEDINKCDCSSIENSEGREECNIRVREAKELRERIENACKQNLGACDCTSIENEKGRKECEENRKRAMEEAGKQVINQLIKCFKDVDECVCTELDLQNENFVDFCEVQKAYGLNCRDHGLDCEKIEEISYVPFGLPSFLEPIFKRTYYDLINKEKEQGARKGAELMRNCITDPENCDCTLAPSYAVDFCERKKQLQIKCYGGNYQACMILEDEPNLPEMMPSYAKGLFESIAEATRKIQEGITKGNAARRVGNMIVDCAEDSSKCDCSFTPEGKWKSFCEHKKNLIIKCYDEKDYNSCFILDEEEFYTGDMPGFIVNHIEKNVVPKIEKIKEKRFQEMKVGTVCENSRNIQECKSIFYD